MKTKYLFLLIVSILLSTNSYAAKREKTSVADRPKLMWVDLSGNWKTFSNPDSIPYYVQKCKDVGINTLVVDVKGTSSAVAYPSNVAPTLTEWKGITRPSDYDFLGTFIKEAHKRGMKVYASFNVFCEGHGIFQKGIAYDTKKQWQSMNYVPGKGIIPITEIKGKATMFVNPALPEVQDYERAILVECAKKYAVDGIMVDRTRYDGLQSDFSEYSKNAFEKYIGTKIERFPEDIYEWVPQSDGTYSRKDGKYFNQWIEWRASVIYNFFKDTRKALKKVRPDVNFAAYTGAWYPSYYEVGANWASKNYDPSKDFEWATPKYKNFAYAELLDLYTNGNYYWNVTLDEYRKSNGTYKNETDSQLSKGEHLCVEGACLNSHNLLKDNAFCGGLYVEDYKKDVNQFKNAVKMNLRESDGLMIFDIVHIINRNWWDALQSAISEEEEAMNKIK